MAKIKFTKTELKSQQDALKQFVRFLPTLQLKKQQLQMEVRLSTEELERNLAEQKELVDRMSSFLELFSSDAEVAFFEGLVRVRRVLTGEEINERMLTSSGNVIVTVGVPFSFSCAFSVRQISATSSGYGRAPDGSRPSWVAAVVVRYRVTEQSSSAAGSWSLQSTEFIAVTGPSPTRI